MIPQASATQAAYGASATGFNNAYGAAAYGQNASVAAAAAALGQTSAYGQSLAGYGQQTTASAMSYPQQTGTSAAATPGYGQASSMGYGQASNSLAYGQSNPAAYGQTAQAGTSNPYAQATSALYGQTSNAASVYGQQQSSTVASAYGQQTGSATNVYGQTTSNGTANAYGQTTNSATGAYGQTTNSATGAYGQTANSATGYNQNALANYSAAANNSYANAFSQQNNATSAYGQQNTQSNSAYGQSSSTYGQNSSQTSNYGQGSSATSQSNNSNYQNYGSSSNASAYGQMAQQSNGVGSSFGQQSNNTSSNFGSNNSSSYGQHQSSNFTQPKNSFNGNQRSNTNRSLADFNKAGNSNYAKSTTGASKDWNSSKDWNNSKDWNSSKDWSGDSTSQGGEWGTRYQSNKRDPVQDDNKFGKGKGAGKGKGTGKGKGKNDRWGGNWQDSSWGGNWSSGDRHGQKRGHDDNTASNFSKMPRTFDSNKTSEQNRAEDDAQMKAKLEKEKPKAEEIQNEITQELEKLVSVEVTKCEELVEKFEPAEYDTKDLTSIAAEHDRRRDHSKQFTEQRQSYEAAVTKFREWCTQRATSMETSTVATGPLSQVRKELTCGCPKSLTTFLTRITKSKTRCDKLVADVEEHRDAVIRDIDLVLKDLVTRMKVPSIRMEAYKLLETQTEDFLPRLRTLPDGEAQVEKMQQTLLGAKKSAEESEAKAEQSLLEQKQREELLQKQFSDLDSNKDGKLEPKDIVKFAKKHHSLTLTQAQAKQIHSSLCKPDGLTLAKFPKLKMKVGVLVDVRKSKEKNVKIVQDVIKSNSEVEKFLAGLPEKKEDLKKIDTIDQAMVAQLQEPIQSFVNVMKRNMDQITGQVKNQVEKAANARSTAEGFHKQLVTHSVELKTWWEQKKAAQEIEAKKKEQRSASLAADLRRFCVKINIPANFPTVEQYVTAYDQLIERTEELVDQLTGQDYEQLQNTYKMTSKMGVVKLVRQYVKAYLLQQDCSRSVEEFTAAVREDWRQAINDVGAEGLLRVYDDFTADDLVKDFAVEFQYEPSDADSKSEMTETMEAGGDVVHTLKKNDKVLLVKGCQMVEDASRMQVQVKPDGVRGWVDFDGSVFVDQQKIQAPQSPPSLPSVNSNNDDNSKKVDEAASPAQEP